MNTTRDHVRPFGEAIEALVSGGRIASIHWRPGQWIKKINGNSFVDETGKVDDAISLQCIRGGWLLLDE